MNRSAAVLFLAFTVAVFSPLFAAEPAPLPDGLYAEFTTPRGIFTCELFFQKAPLCVTHFVGLAENSVAPRHGQPFYTGLKWYRVVPGFVIQSGDPTDPGGGIQSRPPRDETDDQAGHPFEFPDEIVPGLRHDAAGILSMANGGPDTNSSEFFLTLAPVNRLNYLHSVFGRTIRGLDVLDKVQQGDALAIKIIRVGAAAKAFKADEPTLRTLIASAKKYSGPAAPGPTAPFDDADHLIPVEPPRAKNFNYKLANFERFTGVKLYARLISKSPTAEEDKVPGAYMHALAEKLGVAKHGVLAAYFADEKDWRVWIGDEWTSVFLGRPCAASDLEPEGALHDAKTALLAAAEAEGNATFAAQQKAAPPDRPLPPSQQLKLQTDALLDHLIFKLEPK